MNELEKLAAAVVTTLATTRAVRLVVDDDYPPMLAAKRWFITKVGGEPWSDIVECPWCAAPYLAAPAVGWLATVIAFPHARVNRWAWWIVNGTAALSFAASYINIRDIPPDKR